MWVRRNDVFRRLETAPWRQRRSLRGELQRFQDRLEGLLFQVIYTLHTTQRVFPRFRHNDLHLGNVALCPWSGEATRDYRIAADMHVRLTRDVHHYTR